MSTYFVTATGTDIGKTFVTAGLIRHLRAAGRRVNALKPVVSGFDPAYPQGSDPAILLEALGSDVTPKNVERISPWRFADPISPDMAAARAGRAITFDDLVGLCRQEIDANKGTFFIEGVGGVMVPLDDRHSVLDWIAALGAPAIVIAGSYLGTISHTLTALAVLGRAEIEVAALVVNESDDSPVPVSETLKTLERFSAGTRMAVIPRQRAGSAADAAFSKLAGMLGC